MNNAKILNIFDLEESIKNKILILYNQYRDEILNNNIANKKVLNKIDKIFQTEFKA